MSKDSGRLPGNKKEERGRLLTQTIILAPLLAVILQFLELALKLFGVIR